MSKARRDFVHPYFQNSQILRSLATGLNFVGSMGTHNRNLYFIVIDMSNDRRILYKQKTPHFFSYQ